MIERMIAELAKDPFNAEKNFNCALAYDELGQKFSAISFYLRAAEHGYDQDAQLIVYTSLLKLAECLSVTRERGYSVSNCLLQAIAFYPERPEAYFLLSRFYQENEQWQESYAFACMGIVRLDVSKLPADVGFPGMYALEYQRAVAAFWINRKEEAIEIFEKLSNQYVRADFAESIKQNLEKLNNASAS